MKEFMENIDRFICSKKFLGVEIKYFTNRNEYLFFGKKIYTKQLNREDKKIFVVLLCQHFGDTLIRNGIFQNIKRLYPNSKTVYIVSEPFVDIAKYQKDVDEVYGFDKKNKHKGIFGAIKFAKEFPYKDMDYLFVCYATTRIKILVKFLKAKVRKWYTYNFEQSVQESCACFLKQITDKEIINYPIAYNATNEIPEKFKDVLSENEKYVGLCTTTKLAKKDMPIEMAVKIINSLNENGYKVLFLGAGSIANDYAKELDKNNCKYINLINKTSFVELAQVLRNCKSLISVDTGIMHFGYANNVPTTCVFFMDGRILRWAPDKKLYPFTEVLVKPTVEEIIASNENLIRNF